MDILLSPVSNCSVERLTVSLIVTVPKDVKCILCMRPMYLLREGGHQQWTAAPWHTGII